MSGTALAALLTGIAGVLTAWAAVVRARKQGNEHCERELREARAEGERYASELHALRMRDDRGAGGVLFVLAVTLFVACVLFTALSINNEQRGEQGPAGEPGPPGEPGRDGVDGEPGADGVSNVPGPPGSSVPGPPGSSIVGPPGSTGATGQRGATGERGATGAAGVGVPGAQGPAGASVQGPPGLPGATGQRGAPGPTCPEGWVSEVLEVRVKAGGDRTVIACVR